MKKRIISILLLPILIFSVFLVGCDEGYKYTDIRKLYEKMVTDFESSGRDYFGSVDTGNDKVLVISYANVDVASAIYNATPVTDLDRRFTALNLINQNILNYIFNYYQQWSTDFYNKISSEEVDKADYERLYNSLDNLYDTLEDFDAKKLQFEKDVKSLEIANVMVYSVTEYTYELNKVIEASLKFMNRFIYTYNKYCVENDVVSDIYLERVIDETNVRIAEMVYYENVKSFNYTIGDKGTCDLLAIMDTYGTNKYSLLGYITRAITNLSDTIKSGMVSDSTKYAETQSIINDYIYCYNIYLQRREIYLNLYDEFNMYALNKYRFEVINDITIDEYVSGFSTISKVNYTMLEDVSVNTFKNLVLKLYNLI